MRAIKFYERIGEGGRYTDTLESPSGQKAWTTVLYEMRDVK